MGVAQVWSDASGTQLTAGGVAIGCLLVALFAAWRERRSTRRTDPDAIGMLDWRGVQMFALITLAVSLLLVAKA
jgi:hypothetical protein